MADTSRQEIRLFYCYAQEDISLRDELETHLSWLKHEYNLTHWYEHEIPPGMEREQTLEMYLNTAHLIFLLISPDFIASDDYSNKMQHALLRHKTGTCRAIPILLRPTFWEGSPFMGLQLLPTNTRPITRWTNRDEAFQNVIKEISRTIKDLLISINTKEDWLKEGNALNNLKRYEEALAAFEQTIRLDPHYTKAYNNKGNTLNNLKLYEEALLALEQAIQLDSHYALAYHNKGKALAALKRNEDAEKAFEKAREPGYGSR